MPHSTYTGPPATIGDMRRHGLSAFIIECAALYCYHQARIEFDALRLPDELYAIDATKRGDITASGRIWQYDKIKRSISTGAIANGLLFYADFTGYLHCLDVNTGHPYWTHDMLSTVWGSPMAIDGKVYLGDEDGDVLVMEAGKQEKLIATMSMGSTVYSTPVPVNGTLFVTNRDQLFAIARKP